MILFRKEYKQANDNIKVNEELLEKTLYNAFNAKPKKRIYAYRPMTSVAAAVVLVIGCSVAYPRLVDKPVIENNEPVVTIAPVGDEFIAVPDVTAPAEQKPSKAPEVASKITKKPTTTEKAAEIVVPAETAEVTIPIAETEQAVADVPSVARFVAEPPAYAGIDEQLNLTGGYTLQSSENENYTFENDEGKGFRVAVGEVLELPEDTQENIGGNPAVWTEDGENVSLIFNKDNKGYTVETETVTKAELTDIFEQFISEN